MKQKRDARLEIRLTESEKDILIRTAKKQNKSISRLMVETTINAYWRKRKLNERNELLKEFAV